MKKIRLLSFVLISFFLSIAICNELLAQNVFTVTTTDDAGFGSFRQAILDANSTANVNASTPDLIKFDFPSTSPITISPTTALPTISDPVIIDGFSQPGASPGTPLIVINGASTPANTDGLTITGGSSTVQGLVINGFSGNGIVLNTNGGNKLKGNFIGTDAAGTSGVNNGLSGVVIYDGGNNIIGGSTNGDGNLLSGNMLQGILIYGIGGNKIQGNKVGTNITGTAAIANNGGIGFASGQNLVGGTTAAERNLVSGNTYTGIALDYASSVQNTIIGNYIGTDITGTLSLGNGLNGVDIALGAHDNVIGGTTAGERNIISGNANDGIIVYGNGSTGNKITGNYIGTDVTGTSALGNASHGVYLAPEGGNSVGGTSAGEGNIIAWNAGAGVNIAPASNFGTNTNNPVLGNSIFSNTGLGIDLGADGVTPNDAGDADVGANKLQNFPIITSAQVQGNGDVSVTYSVPSAVANSSYPLRIEFYLSDGGQGRTFLSANAYVSADAELSVTQTFTPNALVSTGDKIVATATDANGNTSEFSAPITVAELPGTITITNLINPSGSNESITFYGSQILTVNSPNSIAGDYTGGYAAFGPSLDASGVTGDLQLANPILGSPPPLSDLSGKIAVIDRGSFLFTEKVKNAQDANAIAVIVINSIPGAGIVNMSGVDPSITIPSIFISYEDGQAIKTALSSGTVNVTLRSYLGRFTLQDGDTKTFSNIPPGTYTVTEESYLLQGSILSDIDITDPSGGSSKDLTTQTVTISLASGETVECTFENTLVFDDLSAQVQDLQTAGILNSGQANSLTVKLDGAKQKLLQGKINVAINKLNAFVNELEDFIAEGTLTSAQGQPLIDEANNFIALINGTLPKQPDSGNRTNINSEIPDNYSLSQNFPNPFNPTTTIRYALPENAHVSLIVYNILGQQVAELVNGEVGAGIHQAIFDANRLSSGIYFYRLTTDKFTQISKMLLIK